MQSGKTRLVSTSAALVAALAQAPAVANESYATYDAQTGNVSIPCVSYKGNEFSLQLNYRNGQLPLLSASPVASYIHGCSLFQPVYDNSLQGRLYLPVVQAGSSLFWAVLKITSYTPINFELVELGPYNKMSLSALSATDAQCRGYIETFNTGELANSVYDSALAAASALPGNGYCQTALAYAYTYARGVDRDISKAKELATAAAQQGNSDAQAWLGDYYDHGWYTARDTGHAYIWSYLSADQGNPQGQAQFGYLHAKHGIQHWMETNAEEGLYWISKAADQDNQLGYHGMSFLNQNGLAVPQSHAKSREWLEKCADQGNLFCQKDLGEMYLTGKGVPVNMDQAYQWIKRSADQGHPAGMSMLALYYQLNGNCDARREWNERCHDAGDKSGNCAVAVASCQYDSGNFAQALEWYRLAGDYGDLQGYSQLAGMYERGEGTGKDLAEALRWYERSGELNYMTLGLAYQYGTKGVTADNAKACHYYSLYGENFWTSSGAAAADALKAQVCGK